MDYEVIILQFSRHISLENKYFVKHIVVLLIYLVNMLLTLLKMGPYADFRQRNNCF